MFDELDREIYVAGELIFKAGDPGDCAYLIEKGSVGVFITDQSGERQIRTLGKNELFGEIALIDQQPRTASIRAMEKTVLVPIKRRLVNGLLEKSDPILRHLLLIILERFRSKLDDTTQAAPAKTQEPPAEQSIHHGLLKGEATQRLLIAHGVTRALTHEEFELYYQPICNLADGCIAGFEALIRWRHPTDGMIPPMDFLWLVEQTGLIGDLGLWTLERACRDWPVLRQCTRYESPFVSVNLSPNQLTSESLVDDVKTIMGRHAMPPAELKLELTETVMVEYPGIAARILERLSELGTSLALDDYGTGHSGLKNLQRYPVGTLKIDRTFIEPMTGSPQSMEIVRSSIDLAHSLGMNVVAEGVETGEASKKLLELGCEFGQGWHFGKPVALQDLIAQFNVKI
ncbi:MAG: EAL domain-containing protein [Gallionellaceae bacterium]|nr:EAL domain-containing protein [Gallionellaceae bacterium]